MPLRPNQSNPSKGNLKNSTENESEEGSSKKQQYEFASKSSFISPGEKINFQSEDSQGSNISYESSIQSEQDVNIGQIDYFKQEMGRFFINYPELINDAILNHSDDDNNEQDQQKSFNLNNNWALIADQIMKQAKDSCSFLQSLSGRIALYQSKIHQDDFIDILLKEEKNIMKQIELQINLKKKQSKGNKNAMIQHAEGLENIYFSWRKKKQIQNKLNQQKDKSKLKKQTKNQVSPKNINRLNSKENQKVNSSLRKRANTISIKKRSLEQPNGINLKKFSQISISNTNKFFLTANQTVNDSFLTKNQQKINDGDGKQVSKQNNYPANNTSNTVCRRQLSYEISNKQTRQNSHTKYTHEQNQKNNKQNPALARDSVQQTTFWKHLLNFEPRTQAGRQLCQLIRRSNNPNDQLGIKKTIMQYLVRNKEIVQNQIILKSTISQKIQKLYNEDSKELLMFYPSKMSASLPKEGKNDPKNSRNRQSSTFGSGQGQCDGETPKYPSNYPLINRQNDLDTNNNLFEEGQKFMDLLEDIVEGPLMKYWVMLQENKL